MTPCSMTSKRFALSGCLLKEQCPGCLSFSQGSRLFIKRLHGLHRGSRRICVIHRLATPGVLRNGASQRAESCAAPRGEKTSAALERLCHHFAFYLFPLTVVRASCSGGFDGSLWFCLGIAMPFKLGVVQSEISSIAQAIEAARRSILVPAAPRPKIASGPGDHKPGKISIPGTSYNLARDLRRVSWGRIRGPGSCGPAIQPGFSSGPRPWQGLPCRSVFICDDKHHSPSWTFLGAAATAYGQCGSPVILCTCL